MRRMALRVVILGGLVTACRATGEPPYTPWSGELPPQFERLCASAGGRIHRRVDGVETILLRERMIWPNPPPRGPLETLTMLCGQVCTFLETAYRAYEIEMDAYLLANHPQVTAGVYRASKEPAGHPDCKPGTTFQENWVDLDKGRPIELDKELPIRKVKYCVSTKHLEEPSARYLVDFEWVGSYPDDGRDYGYFVTIRTWVIDRQDGGVMAEDLAHVFRRRYSTEATVCPPSYPWQVSGEAVRAFVAQALRPPR